MGIENDFESHASKQEQESFNREEFSSRVSELITARQDYLDAVSKNLAELDESVAPKAISGDDFDNHYAYMSLHTLLKREQQNMQAPQRGHIDYPSKDEDSIKSLVEMWKKEKGM